MIKACDFLGRGLVLYVSMMSIFVPTYLNYRSWATNWAVLPVLSSQACKEKAIQHNFQVPRRWNGWEDKSLGVLALLPEEGGGVHGATCSKLAK